MNQNIINNFVDTIRLLSPQGEAGDFTFKGQIIRDEGDCYKIKYQDREIKVRKDSAIKCGVGDWVYVRKFAEDGVYQLVSTVEYATETIWTNPEQDIVLCEIPVSGSGSLDISTLAGCRTLKISAEFMTSGASEDFGVEILIDGNVYTLGLDQMVGTNLLNTKEYVAQTAYYKLPEQLPFTATVRYVGLGESVKMRNLVLSGVLVAAELPEKYIHLNHLDSTIIAQVYHKGIKATENLRIYWFIEGEREDDKTELSGADWRCLNTWDVEGEYFVTSNILTLDNLDMATLPQKVNFKCLVLFDDGTSIERDFVINNNDSNIRITLSKQNNSIICTVVGIEGELTYSWTRNGATVGDNSNEYIETKTLTAKVIYKCRVSNKDGYCGSAELEYAPPSAETAPGWNLVVTNADKTFVYDKSGHLINKNQVQLTVKVYHDGLEQDIEAEHIVWELPIENTLLSIEGAPLYRGNSIYYRLIDIYNMTFTNNEIKVSVEGLTEALSAIIKPAIFKQGDIMGNGTGYTVEVVNAKDYLILGTEDTSVFTAENVRVYTPSGEVLGNENYDVNFAVYSLAASNFICNEGTYSFSESISEFDAIKGSCVAKIIVKIKNANEIYYALPFVIVKSLEDYPDVGFRYVTYEDDGTNPTWDKQSPFGAGWEFSENLKDGVPNAQYDTQPMYADNGSCRVYIHSALDPYGKSALNGWDGQSIALNDNGYILAPQVGAGKKEEDNTFTGIVIGTEMTPSSESTGLFGYNKGERSIFLDADSGKAAFGKTSGGQIVIDPGADEAIIQSGNFKIEKEDFINDIDVNYHLSTEPAGIVFYKSNSSTKEDSLFTFIKICFKYSLVGDSNSYQEEVFISAFDKITIRANDSSLFGYIFECNQTSYIEIISAEKYATYSSTGMQIDFQNSIITTPSFKLDAEGNTSMKGEITAESGSIGGWTISGASLQSEDELFIFDPSFGMQLGKNDIKSNNYIVSHLFEISKKDDKKFSAIRNACKIQIYDYRSDEIKMEKPDDYLLNRLPNSSQDRFWSQVGEELTNSSFIYLGVDGFGLTSITSPSVSNNLSITKNGFKADYYPFTIGRLNILNEKETLLDNYLFDNDSAGTGSEYYRSRLWFYPFGYSANSATAKAIVFQNYSDTLFIGAGNSAKENSNYAMKTIKIGTNSGIDGKPSQGELLGNWKLNGNFTEASSAQTDSDRNKKNTITALPEIYSQIFDQLKPVSYKYNGGGSDRTHTGFIAQDVEQAVLDTGLTTKDFAAVCYEINPDTGEKEDYTIRYEELIALCVNEIQQLKKEKAEQEMRLRSLEERLAALESR